MCTGSAGVPKPFRRRGLPSNTQGGVHGGAQSPRAATPPRQALSGTLVLNAGYERSQLPAALGTACTQTCCMEPGDEDEKA